MNVDYDAIKKVIDIAISPYDSRDSQLISFELSYKRNEGNVQTLICPSYRSSIEPIIQELERRHFIEKPKSRKIQSQLKSLESKLHGNSHGRTIRH